MTRLVGGEPWSRPGAAAGHLPDHRHYYGDHFIKIIFIVFKAFLFDDHFPDHQKQKL